MNDDAIRRRLAEAVADKHGSCGSRTVRLVAEGAGIEYTTLARFVLYGTERDSSDASVRQTRKMRRGTLAAVANALDIRLEWLLDGQGARQLGLWPILVQNDAESPGGVDEIGELEHVIEDLRPRSTSVRIKAARAAISAVLDALVAAGEVGTPQSYRSLMRVDALHRRGAAEKVG